MSALHSQSDYVPKWNVVSLFQHCEFAAGLAMAAAVLVNEDRKIIIYAPFVSISSMPNLATPVPVSDLLFQPQNGVRPRNDCLILGHRRQLARADNVLARVYFGGDVQRGSSIIMPPRRALHACFGRGNLSEMSCSSALSLVPGAMPLSRVRVRRDRQD
jgi:hypothetical protein